MEELEDLPNDDHFETILENKNNNKNNNIINNDNNNNKSSDRKTRLQEKLFDLQLKKNACRGRIKEALNQEQTVQKEGKQGKRKRERQEEKKKK